MRVGYGAIFAIFLALLVAWCEHQGHSGVFVLRDVTLGDKSFGEMPVHYTFRKVLNGVLIRVYVDGGREVKRSVFWFKVQTSQTEHKYIRARPIAPRQSSVIVDWNEFLCDPYGIQRVKCLTADEAKQVFSAGLDIVDIEVVSPG